MENVNKQYRGGEMSELIQLKALQSFWFYEGTQFKI